MKKRIYLAIISILTAALALVAFGCDDRTDPEVRVTASSESVTLSVYEVMSYDYASLFEITDGGVKIPVQNSYLNKKGLSSEPGEYTVSCTYGGETASVKIIVVKEQDKPQEDVYALTLSVERVRVNATKVSAYDFKALFTLKVNNKTAAITDDMVNSTVKPVAGEYTYTVSAGKVTKTLVVEVWEYPEVDMIACYGSMLIPENEADGYDFTGLFSLYRSGIAVKVTDGMLDGVPTELAVGAKFTVTATYTDGKHSDSASVPVEIVAAKSVAVSSKNITTYPNAEYIDLTSLFEITYGGEKVETTIDMISGTVDYTKAGENIITLTYDGEEYEAKITVVLGVVIRHAKADTISVLKGTDKSTYSFSDDFDVTVNGSRFVDLDAFIDTTAVDFSTSGTYTAKIKVPYNTQKPSLGGGTKFEYFEQEITYVVTDRIAEVTVKSPFVGLPSDTTVYGVNEIKNNVSVTLNGTPCILVANRDWAANISTNIYVEIISGVDVDNKGDQRVKLDVYALGLDEAPERVEYVVRITSDITVTAHDYAVFVGGTVYTRDLFEITVNGVAVDASEAEIVGKADVFEPGVYEITARYEGITAIAYVTVFDKTLQGSYKTTLTEIPVAPDDDDNDSEDLGWGDEWGGTEYSANPKAATDVSTLGDLIVTDDGIVVNGVKATNVLGLNSNVMTFMLGTNAYTMYLNNGIAVLDPDNSIKMPYSNYRRPMIFFSSALWKIEKSIAINYSSTHVLQNNMISYSIDCFRIVPIGDNTASAQWYGLKVHLIAKGSSDTEYRVAYGEVEFADSFLDANDYLNLSSSCVFDGETFEFVMETRVRGKIKKLESKKLYAGKEFYGSVDGKAAVLRADGAERFTLQADGRTLINSYGNDADYSSNMVNGGPDYENSTLRLNAFGGRNGNEQNDIFSYKFALDVENNTFTVVEKDNLYGRYETADGKMYIFLDGYGYGCISFDTSSYERIVFSYGVSGNEVKLRFDLSGAAISHGDEMSLYVAPMLNVLTVKDAVGVPFGTAFTMLSRLITDGAIVTVGETRITAINAADQVRAAITVIDKNGVWTAEQKKAAVNTTFLGTASGFYLVTVKVSVGGKTVETPYAFRIFENKFASDPLMHDYGNGSIFGSNSLRLDTFGRVNLDVGGVPFIGEVTYADGEKFVAKMHNAAGEYLVGVGELVSDGVIKFTATGSAPFTDYFTVGSSRVIGKTGLGINGLVLREFNVSGNKTYIVSGSATATGEVATVRVISGSEQLASGTVIEISYGNKVRRATIGTWGNASDGLYDVTQ